MRGARPREAELPEVGVFIRCWLEALATLLPPSLLGRLLPLLAIEFIWLSLLMTFPRPPFANLLMPVFLGIGGDSVLHYPETLVAVPDAFDVGDFLLRYLVGTPCLVWVLRGLPWAYPGGSVRVARLRAGVWNRLPTAWLVALPGFVVAAVAVVLVFFGPGQSDNPIINAIPVVSLAAVLLVEVVLAYALSAVALGGCVPGQAIQRSVTLASRAFWGTLGFVLAPRALLLPLLHVRLNVSDWFDIIPPEGAGLVAAGVMVGNVFASYLQSAACARFYLHAYGVGDQAS